MIEFPSNYASFLQPFLTVLLSFLLAQGIKLLLDKRAGRKFQVLAGGGMPSAHSATATALTLVILFEEGLTLLFLTVLVLSCIVLYDAAGSRYEITRHSIFLNALAKEERYKRVGHTPVQVLAGCVLGIIVSVLVYLLF